MVARQDWLGVNTQDRTPDDPFTGVWDNKMWPWLASLENSPMQFEERKNQKQKQIEAQRQRRAQMKDKWGAQQTAQYKTIEDSLGNQGIGKINPSSYSSETYSNMPGAEVQITPQHKARVQEQEALYGDVDPNSQLGMMLEQSYSPQEVQAAYKDKSFAAPTYAEGTVFDSKGKAWAPFVKNLNTPEQTAANKVAFANAYPEYDSSYDRLKYRTSPRATPLSNKLDEAYGVQSNRNQNWVKDVNKYRASQGYINMENQPPGELQRMGLGNMVKRKSATDYGSPSPFGDFPEVDRNRPPVQNPQIRNVARRGPPTLPMQQVPLAKQPEPITNVLSNSNIEDPLGFKATNLGNNNNQTSNTQIHNNGNKNNSANTYRSSTPTKKRNGFF